MFFFINLCFFYFLVNLIKGLLVILFLRELIFYFIVILSILKILVALILVLFCIIFVYLFIWVFCCCFYFLGYLDELLNYEYEIILVF